MKTHDISPRTGKPIKPYRPYGSVKLAVLAGHEHNMSIPELRDKTGIGYYVIRATARRLGIKLRRVKNTPKVGI